LGNGAESTTLEQTSFTLGDVSPGSDVATRVPFTLAPDYPCGLSIVVRATLTATNAASVSQDYRVFPGFTERQRFTFDDGDDGFTANADQKDQAKRGALVRQDVAQSCFMTPRTPERDASPAGAGAFVTGAEDELRGDTSLWSPKIDLAGAVDPELRFSYWLDGDAGDQLQVSLSSTGERFREAKVYTESSHGWVIGRVVVSEVFPDALPESVVARFIFNGQKHLEGGIDDVRVLDAAGVCTPPPSPESKVDTLASCASTALPKSSVAFAGLAFGITALLFARRRRIPGA
jgi:hypothetical protein